MNGGDYIYGDFTFLIWSYINNLIYYPLDAVIIASSLNFVVVCGS
jgi:hypothetical protein